MEWDIPQLVGEQMAYVTLQRCIWNDGCCCVSVAGEVYPTPSTSFLQSLIKRQKDSGNSELSRMYPLGFEKREDSAKILVVRPGCLPGSLCRNQAEIVTKYKGWHLLNYSSWIIDSMKMTGKQCKPWVKLILVLLTLDKECIKIVNWKSLWKWKTFV